ncbi:MAG: glycoside hydrolase family 78 protein [Kiritimatiellae bacterium]|nr:glycoside hydrolase family 78 protein [Kiritimatiellia bacterium]
MERLRCEGMKEAVGVATAHPQFTWTIQGQGEAAASEIRVSDGDLDIWRGRGASLFDGVYAGPPLAPGRVYWWQARLVDAAGDGVTEWTSRRPFVLGLPDEEAWGAAKWIGEDRDFTPRLGDGKFVVEFKPLKGRFVACVRCAPDATGGVTFAVGAEEGALTNDWNRLEIVCRGDVAEASLNGRAFARREGAPTNGTFAVWAEKGDEARMKSAAWYDAAGVRVLHDNYAGSMHLQQVFFRMVRDGRVLIVNEQPYVHPGILPKNCPRYRKAFACGKEVVSAVASVTARGFHELWLNGAPADARRTLVGAPMTGGGWLFETYDVTSLVRRGDNMMGLWLSPGYSDDFVQYGPRWLKPRQALVRLDLRYADGSCEAVVSDGSWEFTDESPVVKTSIYHGEVIDRSLDDPAWCCCSGSHVSWRPVRVLGKSISDGTGGIRLRANDMPPIRRFDPRRPVRITEPKPGVFVADFGQNRAGVVEVRVKGPKGTRIRLKTSEILGKDGMIDPWTNSLAESTDEFRLAGTGEVETFLPRFTYHGFHYVEITGWPGRPTVDDLIGWAIGADVEETSSFSCSDTGLMWLHNAAYWSMRSNLMTFPSDCCMRNERVGCSMDSQAFEDAACQFFDMRRFYHGWLEISGAGGPNPDWAGDATTLARRLWRYYGDRRTYAERYPLMKTACERVFAKHPDGVCEKGYGDWCAPNKGTWDSFFNDVGIVNTSIFAEMLACTEDAAAVLGHADAAKDFAAKRAGVVAAFERRFRNRGTATYGDGSQTTFVLPLALGLVPEGDRAAVTAKLVETIRQKDRTRFDTGIFGTRYIGDVLLDAGEADLFLDLFTQRDFPGFGYMAAQGGTTLWEQWPFKCMMDSHNHAMMSGAASCLYTHLAGIRPAKPGYAEILIKPAFPSRLSFLAATRMTPRGEVQVAWKRRGGGVELSVTVPPFTPAKLVLSDGRVHEVRGSLSVVTRGNGKIPPKSALER